MQPILHHLTFNTGHCRASPRSEVMEDVIMALRPVIQAEGGTLVDGWHLDIMRPLDQTTREIRAGAAYFQIADEPGRSRRPVVCAVLCWQEDIAREAWDIAVESYATLRKLVHGDPAPRMPDLPWLAVWLTPQSSTLTPDMALLLGDAERCIAWALIDVGGA